MAYHHLKTLGELKKSNWKSRTVKEELRENLLRSLKKKDDCFPGIFGYDKSVIPQIQKRTLGKT